MEQPYSNYLEAFTRNWNKSCALPFTGQPFGASEKLRCEQYLMEYQKKVGSDIQKPINKLQKQALKKQTKTEALRFFEQLMGFTPAETGIILGKGFTHSTREFIAMARQFDPLVSWEDIFQAGRNVWIVNSLQYLMNEPVEMTPAIFAYSMLYPYTDNYLDDNTIAVETKQEFSSRFRERLQGQKVAPFNTLEEKIFNLVGLIEAQFNRIQYPQLYQSLLGIHDAQTRSIHLTTSKIPDQETLLSIAIDKGGTSVLADGYLIKGTLTPEQEHFMYGFGVFLQFVDDLQDVTSDLEEGVSTLFTVSAQNGVLESYWLKSIEFGRSICHDLDCFPGPDRGTFADLMDKSTRFMLVESVAKNSQYYSDEFKTEIECFSPVGFDFIEKHRKGPQRIPILNRIRAMMAESEDEVLKMVG